MALTIRHAQMSAMADAVLRAAPFEHLLEQHRDACNMLGTEGVQACVRQARVDCVRYGLDGPENLLRYLNLLVVLGDDFAGSATFSWVADILHGPAPAEAKFAAIFAGFDRLGHGDPAVDGEG